ncbi:MAG: hypothetical protein M5R36_19655 [Deltaproteobacteria bacterium]|nr:hypothetical protein [Deltaproteobacteria bacterium]
MKGKSIDYQPTLRLSIEKKAFSSSETLENSPQSVDNYRSERSRNNPLVDSKTIANRESASESSSENLIQNAIIEGEAYALGFKGKLGSLKIIASKVHEKGKEYLGERSDLQRRLAKSFGGDLNDKFIQDRVEGILLRIVKRPIQKEPRRGFDALVEVLSKREDIISFLNLSEEQAAKEVAKILKASTDDRVVRNIVIRLKSVLELSL